MAYSEAAAQRLRAELGTLPGLTEKRMFGGIGFLIGGNMACGLIGDDLIVRVGTAQHTAALARPGARVFDFSGKPMAGWVMVAPVGYAAAQDLARWVKLALGFAGSLPAK
jgi:TfoX/Sxy family transcriptional regulator of competence genes